MNIPRFSPPTANADVRRLTAIANEQTRTILDLRDRIANQAALLGSLALANGAMRQMLEPNRESIERLRENAVWLHYCPRDRRAYMELNNDFSWATDYLLFGYRADTCYCLDSLNS